MTYLIKKATLNGKNVWFKTSYQGGVFSNKDCDDQSMVGRRLNDTMTVITNASGRQKTLGELVEVCLNPF